MQSNQHDNPNVHRFTMSIALGDSIDLKNASEGRNPQSRIGLPFRVRNVLQPRNRSAFTLVDMVVVLAVLAMIAEAAVFSSQAPLQNVRLQRVLASIEDADRRARPEARRSTQTVELTIDGHNGTATQSVTSGQQRNEGRRSLPFTG